MSSEPGAEHGAGQKADPGTLPEIPLHLLASLPPPIRAVVEAHHEDICRGACLSVRTENSRHRRPTWRLRFRTFDEKLGCHVRRTVSLGDDPTLLLVVQGIVEHLRAARWLRLEKERSAKAQKERKAREIKSRRRQLRKVIQAVVGGSPRVRQQVGRDFDELYGNPRAMLAYSLNPAGFYQPQNRRGRPKGRRLWPVAREGAAATIKNVLEIADACWGRAQNKASASPEPNGEQAGQ